MTQQTSSSPVLEDSRLEAKTERCKARLEALTELTLPTDYPRPIPLRVVEAEHLIDISGTLLGASLM